MGPTRQISLRYGGSTRTLTIPEANVLAVVEPRRVEAGPPALLIARALDNPVGSPPLSALVSRGGRVTILVDDNTRPTPAHLILPPLLERLGSAGVEPGAVTILMAGGTHRPMTEAETLAKVGPEVLRSCRVVGHRWMEASELAQVGCTASGVPVEVNRAIVESDLCIGVGDICPHPLAGWSGGAKILQPGACGARTTAATHGRLADFPVLSFLGREDCPVRLEIEHVARRAGLRFIVNTVLDADSRIAGVFAGDPVAAHRAGVAFARDIWTQTVPDLADIVVASSYPADIDFWQAQKTLHFMECAVRRGGELILLTPCPEGMSGEPHHRQILLKYSRSPAKRILAEARAAGEWDLAGLNAAVRVATSREVADITIVSDGLGAQDCEAMGVAWAGSLAGALEGAFSRQGPAAKVLVLTHGPKVIPVCGA